MRHLNYFLTIRKHAPGYLCESNRLRRPAKGARCYKKLSLRIMCARRSDVRTDPDGCNGSTRVSPGAKTAVCSYIANTSATAVNVVLYSTWKAVGELLGFTQPKTLIAWLECALSWFCGVHLQRRIVVGWRWCFRATSAVAGVYASSCCRTVTVRLLVTKRLTWRWYSLGSATRWGEVTLSSPAFATLLTAGGPQRQTRACRVVRLVTVPGPNGPTPVGYSD